MSSVIGGLFGKKATPVQTNKTGYETLPDFGKQFLQDIIKQGQGYTNQNTGYSPYEVDALKALASGNPTAAAVSGVPNFNFGQQANTAFGDASSAYAGSLPFFQRGGSAITGDEISSGINDFMSPFEDQVVSNVARDINKYGSGLFSDARSLISDAGTSGSNRAQYLASDIADTTMRQVGDFSSTLRNSGFQSAASNALQRLTADRSNALSAGSGFVNAGSGFNALGSSLMNARMNMDALRNSARTNTLADLNNQMSAGGMMRSGTNPENLQMMAELMKLIPVGGGQGSLRENKGFLGSEAGKQLAGATLQFLSSDARLKQDIRPVGYENGHKLYEFSYKTDPSRRYVGVMAQDVEKYMPEAVSVSSQGYKMVAYGMLGIQMNEVENG